MSFPLFDAPEREPSQYVGFAGNQIDRMSENRSEDALGAALGDKKLQFALKFGNLALDHGTADHTQFTIHCMKAEIA